MKKVEYPSELFEGKKVTKCFRFPTPAIKELEFEAKKRAISLNSLMNTLIMTYLKWGRFIERFGGLSLAESTISALLDEIDDISVFEKAGASAGSKTPRRLLMMLGFSPNKDNILHLIDIICGYSMSYRYTHTIIDGKHQFLITHNLGAKWSKWFSHYMQHMFRDLLQSEIDVKADRDFVSFVI
ncbi:hypothetical protein KAW11_01410 [Candidatus Bathyarchaeota archaeon]|nr:hypothetical protein [Candidatus Bathyarchaeota archaeon]